MTPSRQVAPPSIAEGVTEWQELFEHSAVMYFMVDPAVTILAVNTFGAAQLGYQVNELVGQSLLKVFFPNDKRPPRRTSKRACKASGTRRGGKCVGSVRTARSSGYAKAPRRYDDRIVV
jgi:PAS domain S-box-containing protein